MPLFWRVDLDIRARSVAADESYDEGNPAARDMTGWSRPASAIENAIAAIKSGIRGRTDVTSGLLSRGYERIGVAPAPEAGLTELIAGLADLRTIGGIHVVVPRGTPWFAGHSLGEIARQISEYEHPHADQPPGGGAPAYPASSGATAEASA